jgi:acyl-CoA synthetase (AMP-forming)/AMP-acid ligase II
MSNIIHRLKASADHNPNRPALIMQDEGRARRTTFAELWQNVDRCSTALKAEGFKPGERAVVMVSMSAELYIVMLGIIKMGGIAVFVDPWISFKSISAFSAFAEPTAFIGVGKSHLLRLFQRNLRTLPITITTGMSYCGIPAKFSLPKLLCNHSGDGEINDVDPDSTALITFTSGSSGTPKGANRTHRFLNAQYAALSHEFPYNDADVDMPMFPVFALSNLARGITSVIPDMDFRKVAEVNPTAISKQMEKHGVTTCTASPPFFDRLSGYLRERDDEPVELRRILTGGAPVDTDHLQQWQSAFENTSIEVVYGSTEAEPVAHIGAARRLELSRQVETKNRGFCTGRPTSLLQTKIIMICKGPIPSPPAWDEIELPPGDVGELLVSGDHVCRDYYKNPQAQLENKVVDQNGRVWHRMGDTGYMDREGAFWLVGRLHSTIVRNDENFHAQIIEQAVAWKVKDALQVAAIGVPDESMGERIAVVIQAQTLSITAEEIQEVMQAQDLPVDDVFYTTHELPVDPRHNSKIDYDKLRELIIKNEL